MQYEKKVLMLRRTDATKENLKPLSVLARIEIESGVGEFYISVVNLPASYKNVNYYALVIDGDKNEYEYDLGARPTSFSTIFHKLPNVSNGVAIGLYCISEQIPLVLAFANQGNGICLNEFKKIIADKCLLKFKQCIKEKEENYLFEDTKSECQTPKQEPISQEILSQYNDEAVATENYYELDSEIKQKLLSIKEKDSENLFFENEYFDCPNKKTQEKERPFNYCFEDEKNACLCQEDKGLENYQLDQDNYYQSVKEELEQIFFSYPSEDNLEGIFSQSKWAKIYYSKEKYYVVGLIFENKKEKYICYGVPSRYLKNPPKELAGYSSFIPLSVFDMFGDGYFIMFQDANTGKCVHFN